MPTALSCALPVRCPPCRRTTHARWRAPRVDHAAPGWRRSQRRGPCAVPTVALRPSPAHRLAHRYATVLNVDQVTDIPIGNINSVDFVTRTEATLTMPVCGTSTAGSEYRCAWRRELCRCAEWPARRHRQKDEPPRRPLTLAGPSRLARRQPSCLAGSTPWRCPSRHTAGNLCAGSPTRMPTQAWATPRRRPSLWR